MIHFRRVWRIWREIWIVHVSVFSGMLCHQREKFEFGHKILMFLKIKLLAWNKESGSLMSRVNAIGLVKCQRHCHVNCERHLSGHVSTSSVCYRNCHVIAICQFSKLLYAFLWTVSIMVFLPLYKLILMSQQTKYGVRTAFINRHFVALVHCDILSVATISKNVAFRGFSLILNRLVDRIRDTAENGSLFWFLILISLFASNSS